MAMGVARGPWALFPLPTRRGRSHSAVPALRTRSPASIEDEDGKELAMYRDYREKHYHHGGSRGANHDVGLRVTVVPSIERVAPAPVARPSLRPKLPEEDAARLHPAFMQSFPRSRLPQWSPRSSSEVVNVVGDMPSTETTSTKVIVPSPPAEERVAPAVPPAEEAVAPAVKATKKPPVKKVEEKAKEDKPFNDDVLVVEDDATARSVVELLLGKYRDHVHACDTEAMGIDVKKESPAGHGQLLCFSIYCGPKADFGGGKSRLWIDVLKGGQPILDTFRAFFEDASVKKIWHNYSFDAHILGNHGIKPSGFYADTMHLARLWDSARDGYSLEALSSDNRVMDGLPKGHYSSGKTSMKELFGETNVKKDGTLGKMKVLPPLEDVQTGENRGKWIHYSVYDVVCTWHLWDSLKVKLQNQGWYVEDGGDHKVRQGSMYDFYEKYWREFGEVLVLMEAEGMLVDRAHLAEVEKIALSQKQLSVSRFQKWASTYCPDAIHMNVCSDSQIRQLLFGGTANRKDPTMFYPNERTYKVPNTENVIEPGSKVAKKHRTITLKGIGVRIPVDVYTPSGWPAVSGPVLKSLAGAVPIDYDDQSEEEEQEEVLLSDPSQVLTSAGVEGGKEEDVSVYGKAYTAFGGGEDGKKACMAIAALCELSSIDTLISNFIQPLQNGQILGKDGRVHCSLNINTETGRLSARRPNLQNQPALEKDRYKIRRAFVASPGKSLIVADYGQLELRLLAHLAGCRSMLLAFEAGGDFHSRTALNMYPHVREAVEQGKVLLEWDGGDSAGKPPVPMLKDVFGSERRKAKMLNFSIAYGKTARGLANDWKVSLPEAQQTLDLWYNDRQEVKEWQQKTIDQARVTYRVRTLLGRSRHLPHITSSNSSIRYHLERAAINTPVQGSAADVAMCAMLEIHRSQRLRELGWKLILQVHDEVILEGPSESCEEAKELVVKCMSFPFDGKNFLDVKLDVDANFAKSWYEAK